MFFSFLFQVKIVIPSVPDQNHSKYLQFYVFKGHFSCFTTLYIFRCFLLFDHHGRPAFQIFNPWLSFDYFNQAIILIPKNCALGVLRNGLGRKQPKWVILGT